MKRITDQALIRQYLQQVPLTEYFDFDITPPSSSLKAAKPS